MIEWSEQHLVVRDSVRKFIEAEIVPNLEALEHGDLPPYDVLRKMLRTFGIDEVNRARYRRQIERHRALERGEGGEGRSPKPKPQAGDGTGDSAALQLIPIIELCRYCPGMVTAMGVSIGLAASAIMSKGTLEQKLRWGEGLMTLEKIGAWAITEPGSGSDAFGSMKAIARRDGDDYLLSGNKTFITNGPYADVVIFICKLEEPGVEAKHRKVLTFVLDRGMPGLTQSKPLRKMGLHSSPTGELFLEDVRCGKERLLGGTEKVASREGAKDTFSIERTGVAAMALGIIDRCLGMAVRYARERVQFGRPIGEFQLIQEKLAKIEVARLNVQNLVFRTIECAAEGRSMTLAEASAMKLYSARAAVEVAIETLQVYGGNGYMSEFGVEQLVRDARVLQIYAGTDEIQISAIARELLARS
jgi:acyl-CoA dehydrogenase